MPLCFRCAWYDYIHCSCVLDVHGMIIIIRQCHRVLDVHAMIIIIRQCPYVLDVHAMIIIICVSALVF